MNDEPTKDERNEGAIEHPQAPLADQLKYEPVDKRLGGGGGGGTPGATLESRLGDVVPGMGPGDAADTGGEAIDPTRILPIASAGEIPADAVDETLHHHETSAGAQSVSADTPGPGSQP